MMEVVAELNETDQNQIAVRDQDHTAQTKTGEYLIELKRII